MEFGEVKQSMEQCRRSISQIKHQISNNKESCYACENAKSAAMDTYQSSIKVAKERALDEYVKEGTVQFERELNEVQSKYSSVKKEYDTKMAEVNAKDAKDMITGGDAISAEIRASMSVLQDQLNNSVSTRFQAELEQQLETQQVQIDPNSLGGLIKFFNKQAKHIERLSRTNKLDKIIDKLLEITRLNLEGEKQEKTIKLVLAFAVVILSLVLIGKIVLTIYLVFLAVLCIYNVHKHYNIYAAIIAQKSVQDNLDDIEADLLKQATDVLEKEKKSIADQYEPELAQLKSREKSIQSDIFETSQKRTQSFKFDDKESRDALKAAQVVNDDRLRNLHQELSILEKQLQEKEEEYKQLGEKLHNVAGDIQAKYLDYSKVGTDVVFNPQFLFDITNAKPVFFNHPQRSMLIIYNKLDEAVQFVKLLCIQLRIKLNPFNLTTTIIDVDGLGVQFMAFDTSNAGKDESIKRLFRIVTSKDALKDVLDELDEEMARRKNVILRNYDSIADYNVAMVESDSLTENYNFLFYLNSNMDIVKDPKMMAVLRNGSMMGIFPHLLISNDVFRDMKERATDLVNAVDTIYTLQNGSIFKRAKDFALEELVVHDKR